MFFHESHRVAVPWVLPMQQGKQTDWNYNLPNKANKTSELPSKVNELNSNLPNMTNNTRENFWPGSQANKLNSNLPRGKWNKQIT